MIPEEHWHQLKANRLYAIKCDGDVPAHLRFGIGGLFLAINVGEDKERILNSVNVGDGTMTEITRFKQGKVLALGRSSECQIRISHPILSRKHIEIETFGDVLAVKDLGSTNGTYCFSENFFFDIADYLARHPTQQNAESTIDEVHEIFGTGIDEFLKKYSESNYKG